MRKTITFLTLLLLAGCGKKEPAEAKKAPAGADNDSPIIISDTSTNLMKDPANPKTTASRAKVKGGNPYFRVDDNVAGKWHVHDNEGKIDGTDNYRPRCLDFPSGTYTIPKKAETWEILFYKSASDTTPVLTVNWTDHHDGKPDRGHIKLLDGLTSPDNSLTLTKALQVNYMTWSIGGGQLNKETRSGTPLVTVHYCPSGDCTKDNGDPYCPAEAAASK